MSLRSATEKMELDGDEPFINGKRHRPGIGPSQRRAFAALNEKMLFHYLEHDIVESFHRAPDHVEAAFNDVFGGRVFEGPFGDGKANIRLVFHQILERWCVVQRCRDNENSDYLWQVIKVFSSADEEDLPEDYVPSDYRDLPALQHLCGMVGEYRMPHKGDFLALEKFDRWRYGVDQIDDMLIQREIEIERAMDSEWESFEHDFVSHHAHLYMDEANQRAGSMQKSWLVQFDYSERLRCNPKFYYIEERKGYKIRRKRTREEWAAYVREMYRYHPNSEIAKEVQAQAGMDRATLEQILHPELRPATFKLPECMNPAEELKDLQNGLKAEIAADIKRAAGQVRRELREKVCQ